MKKLAIVASVIVSIFVFAPTSQAATTLKQLRVQVYPEYDKPSVLVMQYAFYNEQKTQGSLLLPKDVDSSTILACSPDKKNRNEQKHKASLAGDNYVVNFPVLYGIGFVEGYFPLTANGDNKSFTYAFKAPYNINELIVMVQEPAKSSNFTIVPQAKSKGKDENGFVAHQYDYHDIKKDKVINFKVSYKRAETAPSASLKNNNSTSTNKGKSDNSLVLMIGAVFIAGAIIGGFVYYSKSSNRAQSRGTAHRAPTSGKSKFCTSCGSAMSKNAKFCSNCGQKSR